MRQRVEGKYVTYSDALWTTWSLKGERYIHHVVRKWTASPQQQNWTEQGGICYPVVVYASLSGKYWSFSNILDMRLYFPTFYHWLIAKLRLTHLGNSPVSVSYIWAMWWHRQYFARQIYEKGSSSNLDWFKINEILEKYRNLVSRDKSSIFEDINPFSEGTQTTGEV